MGNERRVARTGLGMLLALALACVFVFAYGKASRRWKGVREVRVVFTNVGLLRNGSRVLYNGLNVGEVREIRLRRLDPPLADFPPLSLADLDVLPLTDDEKAALRSVPPPAQDAEIRRAIAGRTLAELILEVNTEGDAQRYREDDQVRVSTTLMGDAAVEITSGTGRPLPLDESRILLGNPADQYGALASSLTQTRDLAEIVAQALTGAPGEPSLAQQMDKFDQWTGERDKQLANLETSLPKTLDSLEGNLDAGREKLQSLAVSVVEKRNTWSKALQTGETKVQGWHDEACKMLVTGHEKLDGARQRVKETLDPYAQLAHDNRERVPNLVHDSRADLERGRERVEALDQRLTALERSLVEGSRNTRQTLRGLRATLLGLEEKFWYLAHYTSSALSPPEGLAGLEMDIAWRKDLQRWHFLQLQNDLDLVRQRFQPRDASDRARLERIGQIRRELEEYLAVPAAKEKGQ